MAQLHLLPAPWMEPVSYDAQRASDLAIPNPILLVDVEPEADGAAVNEQLTTLRERHPGTPVVLWATTDGTLHLLFLQRSAVVAGVRGVLGRHHNLALLRPQLTDTRGLGHDVATWCLATRFVTDPHLHGMISELVEATAEARRLQSVCRRINVRERTVRHAFRGQVVSPSALVSLGLRLRASLHLQREGNATIRTVEEDLGFPPDSLRRCLDYAFGLPPRTVRQLLGMEPLLARWKLRIEGTPATQHRG